MTHQKKARQTSSREWAIIVVFLALIAAPGIGQLAGFSGTQAIWAIEYRLPNTAPSIPSSAKECMDFPGTTEAFLNDHFGFRSFLGAINGITLQELGSTVASQVLVGKDGWLYHHKSAYNITEEYRGAVTVTDEAIDTWVARMEGCKDWLDTMGIPLVFSIFPNKQSIYPEFLPDWIQKVTPNRFERTTEALLATNIDFVDVKNAILDKKRSSKPLLYYKTDSHWTHAGAFVAYRQVMDHVQTYFPLAVKLERDEVVFGTSDKGRRDLMRQHNYWRGQNELVTEIEFVHGSRVTYAEIVKNSKRKRCKISRFVPEANPVIFHTSLATAPRALVFGDSFTWGLAPLFNESFSTVMYVHHGTNKINSELVVRFKPDIVIFGILEKSLIYSPGLIKMREARDATADLGIDPLFIDRWTPLVQTTQFGIKKSPWIEESGFHRSQETESGVLRFTDGNGKLLVPIDPTQPPSHIEISLASWGTRIADFTVIVNGITLTHEKIRAGGWSRTLSLSDVLIDDTLAINLMSDTFVPAELSDASNDTRVLGVCVRSVRLLAEVKP